MAGRNVVGSHKEMTAVINNLKESRVLDKSVQTLSLEESYATKLLDLEDKILRYRYGRLKQNVGRIKSYLTPEEIANMRTLELEGKFKPEHPVITSSNHSKISAAEKRLKLNDYRRAISAAPRLMKDHAVSQQPSEISESEDVSESSSEDDRSSRIRSQMQRRLSRRPSIMSDPSEVAAVLCKKAVRPHTSADTDPKLTKRTIATPREKRPRPNTAEILERITTAQKASKNLNQKTTFTCHDGKFGTDGMADGLGDVFGPNPYEVRRKSFLEAESKTFDMLTDRQNTFLEDTIDFVKKNPPVHEMRPEDTEELIQTIDSMAKRPGSTRVRSAKSITDRIDSALLKQFAELRKTRYLRIDEDLIDHSGVNTLAKDQFGKTEQWRNYNTKSVSFKMAVAL